MYNQGLSPYPAQAPETMDGMMKFVSIRKELELNVTELEKQLAVKKEMLKLLDENPVIEKFMNLSRGIL